VSADRVNQRNRATTHPFRAARRPMELAGLEPATSWVRSVYARPQRVATQCSSARGATGHSPFDADECTRSHPIVDLLVDPGLCR
jgi:hypothetical protein